MTPPVAKPTKRRLRRPADQPELVAKSGHTRLTQLRLKAALSLEDVAQDTGAFRSTVCRWESGISEPARKHRQKYAECLGVSLAQLGSLIYLQGEEVTP